MPKSFSMKNTILLTCILLLSSSPVLLAQWLPTTPVKGSPNEIFEVKNRLYCSNIGGLFESFDQGMNWNLVYQSKFPKINLSESKLSNVQINGGAIYWSYASNEFFKSSDLGRSWLTISPPGAGITVFVADGKNLYAINSESPRRIIVTDDDGKSWTPITTNIEPIFQNYVSEFWHTNKTFLILFRLSATAYQLYRSEDECRTWEMVGPQLSERVACFPYAGSIFLTATKGYFRSTDEGKSWVEHSFPETPDHIVEEGQLWYIVTRDGNLYRSLDDGLTFEKLPINSDLFSEDNFVNKLYLGSNGVLYAPSFFGVSMSKDSGNTWQATNNEAFAAKGALQVVSLDNNIVTQFSYRLRGFPSLGVSTDEAESWHASYPLRAGSAIQKLKNVAFCIGNGGLLYYTPNRGRTWFRNTTDTLGILVDLAFTEESYYAMNYNGIYLSKDQGVTWKKTKCEGIDHSKFQLFYRTKFLGCNDRKLFAMYLGKIYFSDNEGENWQAIDTGIPNLATVDNLFCFDSIIVASTFTDLIVSTDDGKSWRSIKNGLIYSFSSITVLLVDGKLLVTGLGLPVEISDAQFTSWYEIDADGLLNNVLNFGIAATDDYLYLAQNPYGLYKRKMSEVLKVANQDLKVMKTSIHPNPAIDKIQVDITRSNSDAYSKTELIVVDVFGEIVLRQLVPDLSTSSTLDISELASGVYGVQLRQRDKVLAVEKLVVVR
jgi:photosystem II stability/assembly factor-like uncharacterized protein